ncbi:hypothetical protein [Lysobacter sp. CA199]|uniref:hypothetical protein n=1 Tax=Lysobacter sp. CA199 TaxID=3455608 RepID=UPI003F8D7919
MSALTALWSTACAQPPAVSTLSASVLSASVLSASVPSTAAPSAAPPAPTAEPALALRAVGTEPGWLAEVRRSETKAGAHAQIALQLDYGERKLQVPRASQTADGYAGQADDGSAVELGYRRERCSDGMSDREYPASVSLRVGDKRYQGCAEFPAP